MIKLKHLVLEYVDESLLELVKDVQLELSDMWAVADDSVADFTLDIETAINFANKALQTHDRLDVFKALQKCHDALEKDDSEEEDDLIIRLKYALGKI